MKITSLFADKPYSAIAIAICFAVLLAFAVVTFTFSRFCILSVSVLDYVDWQNCAWLWSRWHWIFWGYAGILSLGMVCIWL